MVKRIVGIAASVGILVGVVSQAPATAQPIDDMVAVQSALRAGLPVGARTAQSIVTTLERALEAQPRFNYFPRSGRVVEGVVQPFLYDTTAAHCLPEGFGPDNHSIGVAQAIAGPAIDTSLPTPALPAGTVNVLFTGINTAMSSPYRTDPMTVTWLNLNTLQSGTAPLYQERAIDSPRTLSNTIETGRGTVVLVVAGSMLDNTSRALPPCDYAPVVGVIRT